MGAVLRSKLANLQIVARRQRIILKNAEELKEIRHRVVDVIEKQEDVLDKKLNVLKVLRQNHHQYQMTKTKQVTLILSPEVPLVVKYIEEMGHIRYYLAPK